jgi:hypothetical protein
MEGLKRNRINLILITLLIITGCKNHKDYYMLIDIVPTVYDLKYDSIIGKYYPVVLDTNLNSGLCLIALNFKFQYIDDPNIDYSACDGCGGGIDTIQSIGFPIELIQLDSNNNDIRVEVNDFSHTDKLPYDPNDIHMNDSYNGYDSIPHIQSVFNIKDNYNSSNENNDKTLLSFDPFYYVSKSTLKNYFNNFDELKMDVITNDRHIESYIQFIPIYNPRTK